MDIDAPTPVMPAAAALAALVREALAGTYARPLVIEQDDATIAVLDGKPLKLARAAVIDQLGEPSAQRVIALDTDRLAWHAVPAGGLRLWRQHARSGADGELVTELAAGDPPVQLMTTEDGWQLVRALDGAQGWVAEGELGSELAASDAPQPARLTSTDAVDARQFVAELERLLDVPYVWGGTTDAGVDCSGIVQRAAWRAGGAWLPRHSRALLRAGARVAPSAAEPGDIYVLQRDPKTYDAERQAGLEAEAAAQRASGRVPATGPAVHPMHVAVSLGGGTVIHASRDAHRVVREPLSSLLERYRVLGVRRLGRPEGSR